MSRVSLFAVAGLATVAASIAIAQPTKETKPTPSAAKQPEHAMPPGMSEADMKACGEAATPGPMHARLTEAVGVWNGKSTMWMAPNTEGVKSECTSTITSLMDGRFTKCETTGEMPGMGPFSGMGVYGYDNVSKKFQVSWIDNCGTGMATGTGELSPDGKTLTWTLNYNCPITKKPTTMREIDKITGKDTMTMEMWGTEPHSGKEFKMMEVAFTRKPGTTSSATR